MSSRDANLTGPWWLGCLLAGWIVGWCDSSFAAQSLPAVGAPVPATMLTNTRSILSLPLEEAKRARPIKLTAQVVYADPVSGVWFVRDSNAGISLIRSSPNPPLTAGDLLEVEGVSGTRVLDVVLEERKLTVIGRAPLPEASLLTVDQLVDVLTDFQWVDVEATVESVRQEDGHLHLVLSGARDIRAFVAGFPDGIKPPQDWVDARLRLRGVWTTKSNTRGHYIANHLFVPSVEQTRVLRPRTMEADQIPVQPLERALRFNAHASESRRIKVLGVVTVVASPSIIYIQEGTVGLRVHSRQMTGIQVGDKVEVLGFPTIDGTAPQIEESVVRRIGSAPLPAPVRVGPSGRDLEEGGLEGMLVTAEAETIKLVPRGAQAELVVRVGEKYLAAMLPGTNAMRELAPFRPSSRVQVTGVCVLIRGNSTIANQAQLVLRSPADVFLIRPEPWWTLTKALAVFTAVATVLVFWMMRIWRREVRMEGRYRQIFENASELISAHSADGLFLDANPAWLALTGHDREQLRKLRLGDLMAGQDVKTLEGWWSDLLAGKPGPDREFELVTAAGRRVRAELRANRGHQGKGIVTVEVFGRDMTSRRASEQQRAQLAAIVEGSDDAIIGSSMDGLITTWNQGAEAMLGHTAEETVGQPVRMLFPNEREAEQVEILARVARGESVRHFETVYVRKDGGRLDVSATISPLKDPHGSVIGVSSVTRDVTERKRAMDYASLENALRAILLRSSGDEMFADVLDFVRTRFGSRFGFFGYIRESDGALVCPSMTREIWDRCDVRAKTTEFPPSIWGGLWGRVLRERRALIKNEAHQTPSGHVPLTRSMGAPLEAEGQLIGSIHLANRDQDYRPEDLESLVQICAILAPTLSFWLLRRKAEQRREEALIEMKASEERFRLVVEAAPNAILMADEGGRVTLVNSQLERLFGYTREELLGRPVGMLVPERFRGAHTLRLGEYFSAPTARAVGVGQDLFGLRKDGSEVPIEIGLSPIISREGRFVLASIIDITERRRMEEERRRLEAQLRQSQKMESIGTLAGGIAHDFNNILCVILGHTELATMELGPGHRVGESMEEIRKAGARAKELVDQILSFSRQEAPDKRLLDLRQAVQEDARLLRSTIPTGIEFVTEFAEDLPMVMADPTEVHQVLLNLCTNAWHAMEDQPGTLTFRLDAFNVDEELARNHADLRPGLHARLSVTDTGTGMDAATLERIFDPFFTTKGVGKGTGLGLAIVHGIMKHHQGAIQVRSQPGQGSTFELYFPAATGEASSAKVPAVSVTPTAGVGQHILHLDDEESLVSLTRRVLTKQGYRVSSFTSAPEALDALRANPAEFDLLVTDYNMPVSSGLEVAREAARLRPDLPVALVSGFITEELQESARLAGVRRVIHKPYNGDQFCRIVQELLQPPGAGQ